MSSMIKEFKNLKNDKARWEWLIIHKDQGLRLELDNDDTTLIDTTIDPDGVDDSVEYYASFDSYVGWSEGVIDLLQAIGIDAESC